MESLIWRTDSRKLEKSKKIILKKGDDMNVNLEINLNKPEF